MQEKPINIFYLQLYVPRHDPGLWLKHCLQAREKRSSIGINHVSPEKDRRVEDSMLSKNTKLIVGFFLLLLLTIFNVEVRESDLVGGPGSVFVQRASVDTPPPQGADFFK